MSTEPINLQNLFLRSDQLSREIAQQSQAGAVQQDEKIQQLALQQQEQDKRVHEIDKDEAELLKVDDDSNSNADLDDQEESKKEHDSSDAPAQTSVSEDYIGQQIDISQ